jgi:hypothetical protein
MTWFMARVFRALPPAQRYSLPPRQITETVLEEAGLDEQLGEKGRRRLTLASHFAYGAATGALFALVCRNRQPSPFSGAAYGLVVWAGSYLGWLPALGILRPATRHPARRTALMIGAHLIWGATLGAALRLAAGRGRHGPKLAFS